MTIGELLKLAVDWLYDLWPLRIVHAWESGVRVTTGKPRALLGTGLHWFIPLLGSLEISPTNTMVAETSLQTHTVEEETVTFTLGIQYHVHDLKAMFESIHDPDETVLNEVLRLAGCAIEGMGETEGWSLLEEIRNELPAAVLEASAESLAPWGVTISALSLITCASAPAQRLLADGWQ
jgi:regulator of protease activity HflC (stomatin/prohibitin superfamily)